MNLLDGIGKTSLPSVLKDPFTKTKITDVRVHYRDAWGKGEWFASGYVEFKNGNTEGTQKFTGETFDDVVRQIKVFIENLK